MELMIVTVAATKKMASFEERIRFLKAKSVPGVFLELERGGGLPAVDLGAIRREAKRTRKIQQRVVVDYDTDRHILYLKTKHV